MYSRENLLNYIHIQVLLIRFSLIPLIGGHMLCYFNIILIKLLIISIGF
jgi:hypothetical protein